MRKSKHSSKIILALLLILCGVSVWYLEPDSEPSGVGEAQSLFKARTVQGESAQPEPSVAAENDPSDDRAEEVHSTLNQAQLPSTQNVDLHNQIGKWREQNRSRAEGAALPFLRGVVMPQFRAVSAKAYRQMDGEVFDRVGGYVVVANSSVSSLLTNFDGANLPVVQQAGRGSYGVLTGEIIIDFREKPTDLVAFARRYQLNLQLDIEGANKAIFYPDGLPTNLLGVAEILSNQSYIESVELSVIYGRREPN